MLHHLGDTEEEQLDMMGNRWSAEKANINATTSDAVVLDVDARAVAVTQILAAIPQRILACCVGINLRDHQSTMANRPSHKPWLSPLEKL
jgi:2-keto-4-pentenoate hydratase/2-oxohepta-3-ene-1,7-dioic acid hydratase in catechol pathway